MKTPKEERRLAEARKIGDTEKNLLKTVIFLTFPRIIIAEAFSAPMSKGPVDNDFLNLIYDNQRVIFKICHMYCTHSEDREDLAQEIIYQLWRSGSSFKDEYKFSTWMYRVALNVAISFYRKRLTMPVVAFEEDHLDIGELQTEGEELEENIIRLQKFIAGLKELDRAIMLLYLEEKTYKEIAEIVGISETNAATKISRIKDILKQKFSDEKND